MLIAWKDSVHIKSFWSNDFCIEVQVESYYAKDSFWVIFVHANTDPKERQNQWTGLKLRKQRWRERCVLGGNLNDIKSQEKNERGRVRSESNFIDFRDFIANMEMGDIKFKGDAYIWANNR